MPRTSRTSTKQSTKPRRGGRNASAAEGGRETLQHELGKRQPFAHPEVEAMLNLLRTTSRLESESERLIKSFGLSSATYNILRILRGHRQHAGRGFCGVPCSQIGAELVTAVPDVTRLIDRLIDAGLVERERSEEDRRVVFIRITKQGLDRLAQIDQPLLDLHLAQLGHLTRGELATLNDLLVKARRPPASPTS